MDITVKGNTQSWRGSSNTSGYRAGHEALLAAKNLHSKQKFVVLQIQGLLMKFTMARFVCQYHKYSVCGIRQPENSSATFTVVNSFVYFTVDEQQANWIFA